MRLAVRVATQPLRIWFPLPVSNLSRTMSSAISGEERKVAVDEVRSFVARCIEAVGGHQSHAIALADLLVAADRRGHFSHGLNRLEMYVNDLQTGTTQKEGEPRVLKETVATAHVDGCNLLGPVVGNFCMQLAIQKAKQVGVGWVVAKSSNHFGIAAWYSEQAVAQGLVGMSFTNTSPLMVPTRAKQGFLGTNPLSLAAPAKDGDSFLLDMATTAVAVGKIEVERRKGKPIPSGWAVDSKGQVSRQSYCKTTTDPNAVLSPPFGSLMPLGGEEVNSGYKGYGLGMMVEVLCGVLAGSAYGPNIRQWVGGHDKIANLGQCFIALDPSAFASGFEDRMSDLLNGSRNLPPLDNDKPVLAPGDQERMRISQVEKAGGIVYHVTQIEACERLAKRLNVSPMPMIN